MNTAIIIPAYNESKHISTVVSEVKALGYECIVVDDGSTDQTEELARKAGATTLQHIVNLGKGAAAKTGCDYALAQGAKNLVLMDADEQHKPSDIERFLIALERADIVFGTRQMNTKMPLMMRLGNRTINSLSALINGIGVRDTQSGFRAMKSASYKKIAWKSTDYGMESEMIANVAKHHLRYRQIPIQTIYKDNYKGTTIFDGLFIVLRLLKWRYT